MRWGRDTVRAQLYVGEQFHWAYLRNGNLGDGLLTRAGYREKFFRHAPWHPADWAALQERILTEAENQGYPFATVGLDSVRLDGQDIAGRPAARRCRGRAAAAAALRAPAGRARGALCPWPGAGVPAARRALVQPVRRHCGVAAQYGHYGRCAVYGRCQHQPAQPARRRQANQLAVAQGRCRHAVAGW
uniref:Uncharacterized protein n=1 Tax=Tanacetum cinerariifolium TaxID=118510 RepID=A0A699QLY0_TANCI|nr:hypothetical protein [Tanacetum cinerariifolium]